MIERSGPRLNQRLTPIARLTSDRQRTKTSKAYAKFTDRSTRSIQTLKRNPL